VRVAHLNLARGYRGGERQTELLIRGLMNSDVEQILVARDESPLFEHLAGEPVEFRRLKRGLLSAVGATRGVDIVHSHEGRGVYVAWLRSLLSGTPYIITRRVNNPLGTNRLTHAVYRRASFVAGVAGRVAEIVKAYDDKVNAITVYSCNSALEVDSDTVRSIRQRFDNKWLVGNIGALDNVQKGQEYIIDVARQLQDTHPDIHFLLVGGGQDEEMLKKMAVGVTNLTFVGFVKNVGDYLAALDLFILPSNKEGIGSILMDAMVQGLPIVASKVGGVPEILTHNENGILIKAGRRDQLRDGILRMYDDKEWCRSVGERGRAIGSRFTPEEMSRQYLGLYRQIMDKG
jgi:glycosyltransferase involved in cell wall biosynthesis